MKSKNKTNNAAKENEFANANKKILSAVLTKWRTLTQPTTAQG